MEKDLQNLICRTSPCQPCIICNALSLLGVLFRRKIKLLATVAWLRKRELQFLNCLIFPFPDDPPSVKKPTKTHSQRIAFNQTYAGESELVCLFVSFHTSIFHPWRNLAGREDKQTTNQTTQTLGL